MQIKKATINDLESVHDIVHKTVKKLYPYYYPAEVVDFFLDYHNYKNITADIEKGNVYLLSDNDEYVGTGGIYQDNFIGRLYILPEYQGKGYGTFLIEKLEAQLAKTYASAKIEASLPSYNYYLKRGYQPKEYEQYEVANHRVLCYHIMEKDLKPEEKILPGITIRYLQEYIKSKDYEPDKKKDYFLKLSEEIGELARVMRRGAPKATEKAIKGTVEEELWDIIYYTLAIANTYDIDVEKWIPVKEEINNRKYNNIDITFKPQ